MGVYRMKLAGRRKPVLLRAENKTDAIGALADGLSLWKPGTPLPADDGADGEPRADDATTTTTGGGATSGTVK